jgi:hypothetical protein
MYAELKMAILPIPLLWRVARRVVGYKNENENGNEYANGI